MNIRPATLADLPAMTEIHNHYVVHTHVTFDVDPFTPEQRMDWFNSHCDGKRYRILVAVEDETLAGYVACGRFRTKAAYDTTVESSIQCRPDAVAKGLGTRLYQALFAELAGEDVHRIVAGIAQPNDASNALHAKLGFQNIGLFSEVGRKFGRYWDVLWMEKMI